MKKILGNSQEPKDEKPKQNTAVMEVAGSKHTKQEGEKHPNSSLVSFEKSIFYLF